MAENGQSEAKRLSAITVVLDHDTMQIAIQTDPPSLNIVLGQMMLDEAVRRLDLTRRQAAAIELKKNIDEQVRLNDLYKNVGKGIRS